MIVKINYKKPNPAIIKKAAAIIKKGGIVIVPTQTVYGILADAMNKTVIKKLLKLKRREKDKRFDLTLYPQERIFNYVERHPLIPKILERFQDEPLSFGLLKKKSFPAYLGPGLKTNAFHFFFSELDKELFKYLDTPLIGTSANISKLPDVHSAEKVLEYFRHTLGTSFEPDLILDAGVLTARRRPSTIIELVGENIKIVREGDIPKQKMEKEIKKLIFNYQNLEEKTIES